VLVGHQEGGRIGGVGRVEVETHAGLADAEAAALVPPILTLEQARRVGELRNQGLTLDHRLRFGVSPSTIRACLERLAAVEAAGPQGQSLPRGR
jgi:hypothetical protein